MFLAITNPPVSTNWQELLPLASPIVVILLFFLERIISFFIRKNEVKRTWYFKVLIDPNIEKINTFYNAIKEAYNNSSDILNASQDLSHIDYVSLKSKEIGVFQKIKRDFEIDVIEPIIYRYPKIGDKLTDILISIEDTYTTNLDSGDFSKEKTDLFISHISSCRAKWFNVLYEPIK